MKSNQGFTLIELIIYSGVIIVCMTILYSYYFQVSVQKLEQINRSNVLINGQRAISMIEKQIKAAADISQPAINQTSQQLVLDSGNISLQTNEQSQLVLQQGGLTDSLTDNLVDIENLSFSRSGLATGSGIIHVSFRVKANSLIDGRDLWEDFQTSISQR